MKVENMRGKSGREIPNQFIISEEGRGANGNFVRRETFQSYKTIIATKTVWPDSTDIVLDRRFWDYSVTTSKYLAAFLFCTSKEVKAFVKDGVYKLNDLNPSDHQA